MAKTELTKQLERNIYKSTRKQGVFGCFEVTIGWFGRERVDYLTYDTKGTWRCYEIKISKADFHSKAYNTFVGHLNYYVMPKELYQEVKDEIPIHIGVHTGIELLRKPKRQQLKVKEKILYESMIRSLTREVQKSIDSNDVTLLEKLHRDCDSSQRKHTEVSRKLNKLEGALYQELGRKGYHKFQDKYEL